MAQMALEPKAKRALFEQAIRVKNLDESNTKYFPKILFVSSNMRDSANEHEVFRMTMTCRLGGTRYDWDYRENIPYYDSCTYFCFASQSVNDVRCSADFELSYEKATKFLELLKPKLFYVCFEESDGTEFLGLIKCVTGNVTVDLRRGFGIHQSDLDRYWERLNSLTASITEFQRIDEWAHETFDGDKKFNTLKVTSINTAAQFESVLKQHAEVLILDTTYPFMSGLQKVRKVLNNSTIECQLTLHDTPLCGLGRMLDVLNRVIASCEDFKQFKLCVLPHLIHVEDNLDSVLKAIRDYYGMFKDLAKFLNGISKMESWVDFSVTVVSRYFEFPKDMVDQIAAHLGVSEVHILEEKATAFRYGCRMDIETAISIPLKFDRDGFNFTLKIERKLYEQCMD